MTLIGITGMQTTVLEEKMAGNYNDRNIAFQAAESTLVEAEEYVMGPAPTYPGGGLYDVGDLIPANLWAGGNSAATTPGFGASFAIPVDPRYVVERITVGTVSKYRITARALGRSPGTQVILQEIYCRDNNGDGNIPDC